MALFGRKSSLAGAGGGGLLWVLNMIAAVTLAGILAPFTHTTTTGVACVLLSVIVVNVLGLIAWGTNGFGKLLVRNSALVGIPAAFTMLCCTSGSLVQAVGFAIFSWLLTLYAWAWLEHYVFRRFL